MSPVFDSLHWCDSYTRMPALIELYFKTSERRGDWFAALGSEWAQCDNIFASRRFLSPILSEATRSQLDRMMTNTEIEHLSGLPRILTVYRGCYEHNRVGLSWSLSRDYAAEFPFKSRYRHKGKQAVLLTGRVAKSNVVLKLGRTEQEIIAPRVRVIHREEISNSG